MESLASYTWVILSLNSRGQIAENLEDPGVPLKKILLWNGVNSWGNMR